MRLVKELLADVYSSPEQVKHLARAAGVPPRYITLIGNPSADIASLIAAAQAQGRMPALLAEAHRQHPDNPWLTAAVKGINIPQGRHVMDNWRAAPEALTDGIDHLVPYAWFMRGHEAGRAVVRVRLDSLYGSGIVVDGLYLVTNNHVISSPEAARTASIDFFYEEGGNVWSTGLDPAGGFATDATDDLTLVAIIDHAARAPDFPLERVAPARNGEYCQVIQHPAGMLKQAGVYHNSITFADNEMVQYLTDTLPGSSGSPVFDDDWNLIAIHRSGGWMRVGGGTTLGYANEGCASARIQALMEAAHGRAIPAIHG